jgi:hypothetical protein
LQEALEDLGYVAYDPFNGRLGKAYPKAVKMFVAPATEGWTRILGVSDARVIPAVSRLGMCLSMALVGEEGRVSVYQNGADVDVAKTLEPHLRAGLTIDDLKKALARPYPRPNKPARKQRIPVEVLPEEVQAMAKDLNPKRMDKMFDRFMNRFARRTPEEEAALREWMAGGQIDWDSPGGQRIRAVMACLTVPDTWRDPDFVTLRDAYQLHQRWQRLPDAHLLPGDGEAMAAVPNALEYLPVYGGIA